MSKKQKQIDELRAEIARLQQRLERLEATQTALADNEPIHEVQGREIEIEQPPVVIDDPGWTSSEKEYKRTQ